MMNLKMETILLRLLAKSNRSKVYGFLIAISILLFSIWGLKFIIGLLLAVVAFIGGITINLYSRTVNDASRKHLASIFLDMTSSSSIESNIRNKMDMRLSGAAIIDETLHEMIDIILRDYVHLWYDLITDDDEFIHELRRAMQETVVNLSSRVKEIDWIPYLTTQLVDDAASHLRLYKTALGKTRENPNNDLVSIFFDLEASMEKNLCRDMVSIDDSHLEDYLQGITEGLFYLLLPQDVYACSPIGSLAQDLLVNHVLISVVNLLSDPDFINQYLIWLCQGFPITSDIFLTVIRTSDTIEEVMAGQDFFYQQNEELTKVVNSQVHEELKNSARQQLKSLPYVRTALDQRLSHLKGRPRDWSDDGDQWQNYFMNSPSVKLLTLNLTDVLKNSVALSYFLDYMNTVGGNQYLLMYLNADAWKTSAEQQLSAIELSNKKNVQGKDQKENNEAMLDCMLNAALNIYDQFLSEKATQKVKLPEPVIKRFYIQARTETIKSSLFDEIMEALIETLEITEKFFPDFTKNKLYIKCLMELDLLKTEPVTVTGDEIDEGAFEEENEDDVVSLDGDETFVAEASSESRADTTEEFKMCRECLKARFMAEGMENEDLLCWEKCNWEKKYRLNAEIIEACLTFEKGKQYGLYALAVTRTEVGQSGNPINSTEKVWHIYRRYSDFYDFHQWIKSKWMRLNKIEFPGKQTFRTTDRTFLEKRKNGLNRYLCNIMSMTCEPCFGESLQDSFLHFLEPGNYVVKKKQFIVSEKLDNLVNPFKQSVKSVTHAVKSVPDTLFHTVDGFTKLFNSKNVVEDHFSETLKVGASIDAEVDDNIPLRIILLLMDEVFDLKSRHQWLRRRIVAIIRQILKAMMGDIVNRRIVDYVSYLTSPIRVSGYLRNLQKQLWPDGRRISNSNPRDLETKMRTRIGAKASIIASLPDELKHLIGSETTRRGLISVFDMFQEPVLNRRFLLVLFEGILKTMFPDKPLSSIIQRLHYRSSRVGKQRPFLVPNPVHSLSPKSNNVMAHLSPRGSRKKK